MVATNNTGAQFKVEAVTGVARGQNVKTHSGNKNISAPILMASPYFPSDHRRAGNGISEKRLHITQLMVMKYEHWIATAVREMIAFRTTMEPKLMHTRAETTMTDTKTALNGM